MPTPTLLLLAALATPPAAPPPPALDADAAGRFAALALACVHQEYPNKIAHVLQSDADVAPPRRLTPAFHGCFDWHSAVHGHWLSPAARLAPDAPYAAAARAALAGAHPENLAAEAAYLPARARAFERPYGLACSPARRRAAGVTIRRPRLGRGARAAGATAVARLTDWLPKLTAPIRIGEHDQTAFALGLALDWARGAGDRDAEALFAATIRRFYAGDRGCPLAWEPSGHDFLSPCLAEADAVRRVLPPAEFAAWLTAFLPELPRTESADWLLPGVVTDPSDPKLAHLDGLNLSRA